MKTRTLTVNKWYGKLQVTQRYYRIFKISFWHTINYKIILA